MTMLNAKTFAAVLNRLIAPPPTAVSNCICTVAYGDKGQRVVTGSRSSEHPARDHHIGQTAIEFYYAVQRGVDITPEVLWNHVMGTEMPDQSCSNLGKADVWHEGSKSFYRALLLSKHGGVPISDPDDDAEALSKVDLSRYTLMPVPVGIPFAILEASTRKHGVIGWKISPPESDAALIFKDQARMPGVRAGSFVPEIGETIEYRQIFP